MPNSDFLGLTILKFLPKVPEITCYCQTVGMTVFFIWIVVLTPLWARLAALREQIMVFQRGASRPIVLANMKKFQELLRAA